jgi:phosphoenolpyruvate---glycerone phosphotransferase subunit DhaL
VTADCDGPAVAAAVRAVAAAVARDRVELTRLDRDIGDGDHGENLNRGFQAVLAKLDAAQASDAGAAAVLAPGAVLRLVATTLISTVGGAAGPLYGTAFLRAATSAGDAAALDPAAVAAALAAARDGVVARGKAEPGDKTMVDALDPAVAAAQEAASAPGATVAAVLSAAAQAADGGAAAAVPLVARKGRASYLGERSAGHPDPGATSTTIMLRALAAAAGS